MEYFVQLEGFETAPSQLVFVGVYFQVSAWFFTTFTVSGLKDKIHYVESLQQLFTAIPPEQIDLPPFVLEYDARVSDFMWHLSVCVPKCSYCVSPILLCKTCKGIDLSVLRMCRIKRGFLESLVSSVTNDFLRFFFSLFVLGRVKK